MIQILKKIKLCTLYVVVFSFCFSCKNENTPKKQRAYYTISYGGFTGGRYTTYEYKIKDGWVLFLNYRNDSIRIKESKIDNIKRNNN